MIEEILERAEMPAVYFVMLKPSLILIFRRNPSNQRFAHYLVRIHNAFAVLQPVDNPVSIRADWIGSKIILGCKRFSEYKSLMIDCWTKPHGAPRQLF